MTFLLVLSSLGAWRQAQPPSLPPAGVTQAEPPTIGNASATLKYDFEWQQGFIGSGGDVRPPQNTTLSAALAECDAEPRCRGITYAGAKNSTTTEKIYFKMSDGVSSTAGWSAWLKRAEVTPPALTVSVGGTSRLELRLREGFYSVQNLSRSGDKWSFSRPLDETSSLPLCAHLGDLTLRLRSPGSKEYSMYSTISLGAPATPIPLDSLPTPTVSRGQTLAAQDITALLASSLPDGPPLPLVVTRSYERSADGAALVMRFNLTSTASHPIELGGVGMALPESPGQPPAGLPTIVWNDPHVGGEHGFVEFIRVVNDEATLLVTAEDKQSTPFEAWRPMLEDLGKGDAYEWTVSSKAWAAEWVTNRQYPFINMSDALKQTYPPFAVDPPTPWPSTDGKVAMPTLAKDGSGAANPWNPPTSITLAPGASHTLALRLQLASAGPRTRDAALTAMGAPVVKAVPGYVLPTDAKSARLLVKPPPGRSIVSVAADRAKAPSTATLAFSKRRPHLVATTASRRRSGAARSTNRNEDGFETYGVAASGYGRVRVLITFSDGTSAACHYFVLPPFKQQVSRLGAFLADTAWLPRDYVDPFGRSASVMPWDRSPCSPDGTPCGHVLNDARAYDVGLSDDAGGGNPLCLASKVRAAPTQHEVSRIDEYIEFTLYGIKTDTALPPYKSLQIREEEVEFGLANPDDVDGIRMTMFYYADDLNNNNSGHFDWNYTEADKCHKPFGGPTWCMTENMANATYRGFNYPHQIASYWALYSVARHTTLHTRMPWEFYLYRAGKTSLKLGTAGVGFMDGTVAREVLNALLVEATANATSGYSNQTFASIGATLRANMLARQQHWAATPYPYGSEFGFDTTGQEEVVVWNLYFGNESVAKQTVDHILSYMRNSPTWAYHGGARSWGDIGNNGKYLATYGTGVADRGQMHYRSGLNMIPLIEWYRRHPEEGTFLLEISMGAISGQMTNIDPKSGASSMMFHATAHVMDHDPHTGDYGLGFFGNALESGSYFVHDGTSALGPLCFLCDLEEARRDDGSGYEAEASVAPSYTIVPRDGFGIAVFIEPLGLYMTSQCGSIASVGLPAGSYRRVSATASGGGEGHALQARSLTVTFETGGPCEYFRLAMNKTAASRPGSGFSVHGAPVVRGAFQIKPAASGHTTAEVSYSI